MSLTGKRAQIAAALSTVDGVTGFERRPRGPRPGDAWPLYQGAARDGDTGLFAHTFAVGLMLPQDEAAADDWIDGHLESIADALARGAGWMEEAEPANFGTDTSPVYGLLITMRSE